MRPAACAAVVLGVALATGTLGAAGCAEPAPRAATGTGVLEREAPRPRAAPPSLLPADPLELARRLVEGSVAPKDVPADRVAEAAALVLVEGEDGEDYAEEDLLRRLDVLRRLGPAASAAVDVVVRCGGATEITTIAARATLDAIDPARTLRIEPFLREAREDHEHGMDAAHGLWSAGPAVIPRLTEAVGETAGESWRTALAAADVLAEFGPAAAAALPVLRAAMRGDDGSRLRDAATEAVLRISEGREPPLADSIEFILSRDELRAFALAARPAIDDELAGLLTHERPEVKAAAARVLFERAPETPGLAEALAAGLTLSDRDAADTCRRALVDLGPRAAPAIPSLVALLQSGELGDRWRAAGPLAATGDRETALPVLRAEFTAVEERRALDAELAEALVRFGPREADVLLPRLVAALGEEHTLGRRAGYRTVRGWWWAAERLGDLGPAAASAIPALIDALDENSGAAEQATEALVKIGATAVEPLATAVATSGRDERRIGAAATLGRMGPAAERASGRLRGAFTDPSPRVRAAAAAAIVRIEPTATDAPTVLTSALAERRKEGEPTPDDASPAKDWVRVTQRTYEDRQRLWAYLGALGPEHAAALPAVRAAEVDADESIRIAAFDAERRITGDARPLVAECVRQIEKDGYSWSALHALPSAGAAARDALPALERALLRAPKLLFDAEAALAVADPSGRLLVASLAQVVALGSDSDVERACEKLATLGPAAAAAVPALTTKLERICSSPQGSIVEALGAIGPAAAPAVPQIRLRLDDFYADTRAAARAALQRIEPR